MSTDFVTPGFVDVGFVSDSVPALLGIKQWTDCREYPRGSYPGDWTARFGPQSKARIEGSTYDGQHRNKFHVANGTTSRALHTWNVIDSDPYKADQEFYGIARIDKPTSDIKHRLWLRASGSGTHPNGYQLTVTPTGLTIDKFTGGDGTKVAIGTLAKTLDLTGWVKILFGATSQTIRARVWMEGNSESGSWDLTVVDATYTTGWIGIRENTGSLTSSPSSGENIPPLIDTPEFRFISVATGEQSTYRETILDTYPPLEQWIRDENEPIDVIACLQYYNSVNGNIENLYVSKEYRDTGKLDFPSLTKILPYLIEPGSISTSLVDDLHLGGSSSIRLNPLRLRNEPVGVNLPGLMDHFPSYSFSGRPIIYKIGKKYSVKPSPSNPRGTLSELRRYEAVGSGVASQEPEVGTNELVFQSDSTLEATLKQDLSSRVNVGISTCIRSLSSSGWLSIPSHASYNLKSFVIYLRAYIPELGISGSGVGSLSLRQTDATHRQWHIAVYQTSASPASLRNKIHFLAYKADGTLLISQVTSKTYNLGRFVNIIFAVNSGVRWYAYIDNEKVGSGSLSSDVTIASSSFVSVLLNSIGCYALDHRIEHWVVESTALTRFSSRLDPPDVFNISMHRCDDNIGSTVTDYNTTTANHGNLQGTDLVDRAWEPSYLGSVELSGTPMPVSGGILYNAPVQYIDPNREIVRHSDRAKTEGSVLQVRAKGVLLTSGANYSEPLEGPGTADIVGASDQPVTFGLINQVTADNPKSHIPRLIADEVADRGSLNQTNLDMESFYALRNLLPFQGGFSFPGTVNLKTFISQQLGSIGGHTSLDHSGRIYGGCLLPPVNPGPFGHDSLLEFLGVSGGGVIIQHNDFRFPSAPVRHAVSLIFKVNRSPIDPSVPSTLSEYFPAGFTLLDCTNGASGYYLGIDGRDGKLIWGHPGVTGHPFALDPDLHYIKHRDPILPNTWYWVYAKLQNDIETRQLIIGKVGEPGTPASPPTSNVYGHVTVGTYTPPPSGTVLKIGNGSRGSFYGSLSYVIGAYGDFVASFGDDLINDYYSLGIRPVFQNTGNERYWIELRDGSNGVGDYVTDRVTGATGYLQGCRWSPRIVMDLRSVAGPVLPSIRRPIPAWKIDTQYKENYNQLLGADVAGSVSASERVALGRQRISKPSASEDVKAVYKDSREVVINTPLIDQADADFITNLMKSRISTDRRFSVVKDWYREVIRLMITDEVLVYSNRLGYENGRAMRIHELTKQLQLLSGEVAVWG